MLKMKMLAMTFMALLPMSVMAADGGGGGSGIKVKVTAGKRVLTATFIDNATTRALVAMFPLTVPMMDLYSRELVYRFPEALPANEKRTSGYEVGDIVYWAPRHSFVIMYAQNGERISDLQKIGRIDSGVEVLGGMSNTDVTFELLKD
ncbi:cyclophilin-like fold protein [Ralstonia nicotianae]